MADPTADPIADPLLRQLYDYWQKKRGNRAMPSRADIDPAELRAVLPHLMLTDIVDGGRRFRYRLVGTAVAESFGKNMTGMHIDELMTGTYRQFIEGLYRDIVEKKRPVYSESTYFSHQSAQMWAQRLMLPLSDDGVTVNMVLSGQTFRFGSPLKTMTVRLAQESAEEIRHLSRILE